MKNLKAVKSKNLLMFRGNNIQEINRREQSAIERGEINCLIKFSVIKSDIPVRLSADLTGFISLMDFLETSILTKRIFSLILNNGLRVFDEIEKKHFSRSLLLYNPEYVYLEPATNRLWFVYIPIQPLNTEENPNDFFKGILKYAQFDSSEDTSYVQNYIRMVNEPGGCSRFILGQFLNYILAPDNVTSEDTISEQANQASSSNKSLSVNEDENGVVTVFRASIKKRAFLVSKQDNAKIEISKSPYRIGKQIDLTDYRIENNAVSRKHADIVREHDSYYVIDLNSTNGTFINGRKVQPGVKEQINNNDVLCFSNSRFTFIVE